MLGRDGFDRIAVEVVTSMSGRNALQIACRARMQAHRDLQFFDLEGVWVAGDQVFVGAELERQEAGAEELGMQFEQLLQDGVYLARRTCRALISLIALALRPLLRPLVWPLPGVRLLSATATTTAASTGARWARVAVGFAGFRRCVGRQCFVRRSRRGDVGTRCGGRVRLGGLGLDGVFGHGVACKKNRVTESEKSGKKRAAQSLLASRIGSARTAHQKAIVGRHGKVVRRAAATQYRLGRCGVVDAIVEQAPGDVHRDHFAQHQPA